MAVAATPRISVVMPALDEAARIDDSLAALAPLRERGHEVIVVDGGSKDDTPARAARGADIVIAGPLGRARQMNAGAAAACGEILLFLHADTLLPPGADRAVLEALAWGADWGRFDVAIDGRSPMLRVVSTMMNLRSRCSGIATGDQALFVRRQVFERLGGFPDQPLMEDVEMSRRLLVVGTPACLRERVSTSGRRWETRGVWRTVFLMWALRWHYWRGRSAEALARAYE